MARRYPALPWTTFPTPELNRQYRISIWMYVQYNYMDLSLVKAQAKNVKASFVLMYKLDCAKLLYFSMNSSRVTGGWCLSIEEKLSEVNYPT